MLRNRTIAIIAIALSIAVILIALIASESAQYTNPIHVENGVTMISTTQGDQVYSDVEYIHGESVSVKLVAITTIKTPLTVIPAELPHASVAHGDYTCNLSNHGVNFTVTQTTPCE